MNCVPFCTSRMACRVYIVGVFLLFGLLLLITEGKRNYGLIFTARLPRNNSERTQHSLPQRGSIIHKNRTETPSVKRMLGLDSGAVYVTDRSSLKKDWCNAELLEQTIHEKGCKSRVILNRFCYGQCNSFYIPGYTRKGESFFKSCSFCKPDKFNTKLIVLRCPDLRPPWKEMMITRVKSCRCTAINVD
ncbi:gremlin-1 [Pogona vitticeps]